MSILTTGYPWAKGNIIRPYTLYEETLDRRRRSDVGPTSASRRWPDVGVPTLARRWPDVGVPTSAFRRWPDVGVPTLARRRRSDVGPTLPRRRRSDVGPTSAFRRWPDVGVPTLARRRRSDVGPTSAFRRCPDVGVPTLPRRRRFDVGPSIFLILEPRGGYSDYANEPIRNETVPTSYKEISNSPVELFRIGRGRWNFKMSQTIPSSHVLFQLRYRPQKLNSPSRESIP
ncbi:unnamed protein product, partial [Nesidiocoris tenuis]